MTPGRRLTRTPVDEHGLVPPSALQVLRAEHCILLRNFWPRSSVESVGEVMVESCTADEPWSNFPHRPHDSALRRLAVGARVRRIVEQVLGTGDLFLAGSHFQSRWSSDSLDIDQPPHLDEGTNTLLVDPHPTQYVVLLTYWTDVTIDDAPTWIYRDTRVLEQASSGIAGATFPRGNPATWFPEGTSTPLPGAEAVTARAGDALLYDLHLVHHGSRFTSRAGNRVVSWFSYRPTSAVWSGQDCFSSRGNTEALMTFMEESSPEERALLGVPLPGHHYWSQDTVERVGLRYPKMDMSPYAAALPRSPEPDRVDDPAL